MNLQAILVGCLLSCAVQAEPLTTIERSTTLIRESAKVKLTKQESGVVACKIALDDVIAGEHVELRGRVVATNDSALLIGVTVEIMQLVDGFWRDMRTAPNGSDLDGGNLTTQQHHGVYTAYADYATRDYSGRQTFAVVVWAYRRPSQTGYLDLDGCSIRAERNRP